MRNAHGTAYIMAWNKRSAVIDEYYFQKKIVISGHAYPLKHSVLPDTIAVSEEKESILRKMDFHVPDELCCRCLYSMWYVK